MTLNYHYALHCTKHASFGAYNENLNEDRPTLWRRRCSSVTLVSVNERFMRIFEEVRWRESGIVENVRMCWTSRSTSNQRYFALSIIFGQTSRDTGTYVISQKSLFLSGKCLHPDQTQSFPNLPYPLSVRFSSAFQSPNGCSLRCEFRHSSHGETVCQTVCFTVQSHVLPLHALTLWNTIILSFQYKYQAARSNV